MWWPMVHVFFQELFQILLEHAGTIKLISWCLYFQVIWLSAAHSLEHFLKLVIMKLHVSVPASHHYEGDTMTAAHSHSHMLFWLPQVLLMHFHYQAILIPLVALPPNSESCHWHWVISSFAWLFLDRSNTAVLVCDQWRGGKLASALENSSILSSVHGTASNTIVCCCLITLPQNFDISVELSAQPSKWQMNCTFWLSKDFVALGRRQGSKEQWANRRTTKQ